MPIPPQYAERCIYHFTHIDNLPKLLHTGFLAKNHVSFPKKHCRSIAEESIQTRRSSMCVTCGPGGAVHDYVPLYFGSLSPMLLAVINKKNVDQSDILYFEYPITLLDQNNVVFCKASANTVPAPTFFSNPADLTQLNWAEIDSLKWSSATDQLRHERMAEVLVHSSLALQSATRIVVWNEEVAKHVRQAAKNAGVTIPPVEFQSAHRRHWFLNFTDSARSSTSLVTGPKGIWSQYKQACQLIAEAGTERNPNAFGTPKKLLEALRQNFSSLPQTAELVGLQSSNGVHRLSVDMHTKEVVKRLKALPEFARMPSESQDRVELAAYLHDIGKGPKSRWSSNDGLQKVDPDHPVKAMPMMVEIMTTHVSKVKQENAELILKLVCYHDLIGEVLGKGRAEHQIVDVAFNKLELDMLFALGKADATSLSETWWNEVEAKALYARCCQALKTKLSEEAQ